MRQIHSLLIAKLETHEAWQNARLAGIDSLVEERLRSEYLQAKKRVTNAKASGEAA